MSEGARVATRRLNEAVRDETRALFLSLGGVGPNDDRVEHGRDLVGRHPGALGLLAHLLGAGALVDAEGPEAPRFLLHRVRADPANVAGHLLADLNRPGGGLLECIGAVPEVAPADDV
jgi:hypothetical protein